MIDSDFGQFSELLAHAHAFYRKDVSEFAIGVWWEACRPFDIKQVRKALTQHCMDPERGRFAPMPSDIVRELQGTHVDRSVAAWGKVLAAISSVGAYRDVDFGDMAVHAAIADIGGWVAICRCTFADLPHFERRFKEAYRVYSKRPEVAASTPAVLLGEHSVINASKGVLAGPGAVRIGTPRPQMQHASDALTLKAAERIAFGDAA